MSRPPEQQLHHELSVIVKCLPENAYSLSRTLAALLGDERAVEWHGVTDGLLDVFSPEIAREAKTLIAGMAPEREARAAAARQAEEDARARLVPGYEPGTMVDPGPGGYREPWQGWRKMGS